MSDTATNTPATPPRQPTVQRSILTTGSSTPLDSSPSTTRIFISPQLQTPPRSESTSNSTPASLRTVNLQYGVSNENKTSDETSDEEKITTILLDEFFKPITDALSKTEAKNLQQSNVPTFIDSLKGILEGELKRDISKKLQAILAAEQKNNKQLTAENFHANFRGYLEKDLKNTSTSTGKSSVARIITFTDDINQADKSPDFKQIKADIDAFLRIHPAVECARSTLDLVRTRFDNNKSDDEKIRAVRDYEKKCLKKSWNPWKIAALGFLGALAGFVVGAIAGATIGAAVTAGWGAVPGAIIGAAKGALTGGAVVMGYAVGTAAIGGLSAYGIYKKVKDDHANNFLRNQSISNVAGAVMIPPPKTSGPKPA